VDRLREGIYLDDRALALAAGAQQGQHTRSHYYPSSRNVKCSEQFSSPRYPNPDIRMRIRTLSTSRSLDTHVGKRSSPVNTGEVAVESDVTRGLVFASMRLVTAPLAGMKIV
jgi:hypothetical protein